jgi:hypothetical protein
LFLGISWLGHAGFKLHAGVGEGTVYSSWIGDRHWLHLTWCGCEAGLGLSLLSGRAVRASLFLSTCLLAMLTGLILLEPLPKPCGCASGKRAATRGAAIEDMRWSLGRNGLLLAVAFVASALLPPMTEPTHKE